MNDAYREAMLEVVNELGRNKDAIVGVVLTSAKQTVFAGGNLEQLSADGPDDAGKIVELVTEAKAQLRKLETFGRPVASALVGTALGGGLAIALATHHRVGVDATGVVYGLPEVSLGLLPGGGGVTRVTRMLGIANGFMTVLAQGQRHKPAKALELGLIDEPVATREEAFDPPRGLVLAHPQPP
ncbi:enoyl-CoA hydratase/isomerase family protein, partial [Microbacterium sp. HSID17254]|uniref:enoyl-CoA hydratase/isomerase family protein n=1 Tax=Microbacterium sp. HSID17254 TaxID=2419509 RepID=UPI0015772AA5